MTFKRIQKIFAAFFIATLLPAYFIAQWRYDVKLENIDEMFEREHALHLSTDKLLINCQKIEEKTGNHYDSSHQVCTQGFEIHEHTTQTMDHLNKEKLRNEKKWYRDFFFSLLFFNLLGVAAYHARRFIGQENT